MEILESVSLDKILAELDEMMKQKQKESDEIRKEFLDGEMNMRMYMRKFTEVRREYHLIEEMRSRVKNQKG